MRLQVNKIPIDHTMSVQAVARLLQASHHPRYHHSEAMRRRIEQCPEHLFSTDAKQMRPLN